MIVIKFELHHASSEMLTHTCMMSKFNFFKKEGGKTRIQQHSLNCDSLSKILENSH